MLRLQLRKCFTYDVWHTLSHFHCSIFASTRIDRTRGGRLVVLVFTFPSHLDLRALELYTSSNTKPGVVGHRVKGGEFSLTPGRIYMERLTFVSCRVLSIQVGCCWTWHAKFEDIIVTEVWTLLLGEFKVSNEGVTGIHVLMYYQNMCFLLTLVQSFFLSTHICSLFLPLYVSRAHPACRPPKCSCCILTRLHQPVVACQGRA